MFARSLYSPFGNINVFHKVKSMKLSTKVRVATYNVLSSELADPNHFVNCRPEYLDASYRLASVKDKLQREIYSKSVICLQEVSQDWAGKLHPFFASQGYHLITALYGKKFNGYMGVAMAVPTDKFEIKDVDICRVSDDKQIIKTIKDKPEGFFAVTTDKIARIIKNAKNIWYDVYKEDFELWDSVKHKHNQMICTELVCKTTSESCVIGTYHMPCAFKTPEVMVAHTALSAQHLQAYAERKPHLFVGDFNFKPYSSMYELMTTGMISKSNAEYPHTVEGDNWQPNLNKPLSSAFMTFQGKEPDFTNHAQVRSDPLFVETLDYIFHSPEWKVEEISQLPSRESVGGPLPTQVEPSDHLLIAATLSLPESTIEVKPKAETQ